MQPCSNHWRCFSHLQEIQPNSVNYFCFDPIDESLLVNCKKIFQWSNWWDIFSTSARNTALGKMNQWKYPGLPKKYSPVSRSKYCDPEHRPTGDLFITIILTIISWLAETHKCKRCITTPQFSYP
jgi:hypothetical protein